MSRIEKVVKESFDMASTKGTAFVLLFLLQSQWILCQYPNPYGGYGYPPIAGYSNDRDNGLDILLPILLIALCNNGGLGGGGGAAAPYPYAAGYGSGCGGCGGCCGCGGCGGCGGCRGCGCGGCSCCS